MRARRTDSKCRIATPTQRRRQSIDTINVITLQTNDKNEESNGDLKATYNARDGIPLAGRKHAVPIAVLTIGTKNTQIDSMTILFKKR